MNQSHFYKKNKEQIECEPKKTNNCGNNYPIKPCTYPCFRVIGPTGATGPTGPAGTEPVSAHLVITQIG